MRSHVRHERPVDEVDGLADFERISLASIGRRLVSLSFPSLAWPVNTVVVDGVPGELNERYQRSKGVLRSSREQATTRRCC